jgi:C_GCAxxG_C_C family probable redox protein
MVERGSSSAREAALARFRDLGPGHLNCAQAVVHFASLALGLSQDSVVMARYFGGGIARTGQVCGALSGCAISLGLRDLHLGLSWPDGTSPDTENLQRLCRDFEAQFGAMACRDLVGYDIGAAGGYRRFKADGKYELCEQYVSWACDRLADALRTACSRPAVRP